MGIGDFFKKRPSPERGPVTPSASGGGAARIPENPGVTTIEREHFLLRAPFQWVAISGDKPLHLKLRNQTLREQLIVTVLPAREPVAASKLQSVAETLAMKRINALVTISSGNAVHSPLQIQSGSGQVDVRSTGYDQLQKVRFAFVVPAAPAKAATVAMTRYFFEEIGSPFEVYSNSIFDFLVVKDPGGSSGA